MAAAPVCAMFLGHAAENKQGTSREVCINCLRDTLLSQLLGASRRVPPAVAVAEVIREKGPTRVQSGRRRPLYPVPSNGPPSAPTMDTAPRSKRKKAPPPATP
ncbi:unnamed protein product [Pleuronectes platessa]|uniref:Uncharacterized protein n=1 Tax=Pleuronectes platessa TaxID=8262 RepID=A0A9N7YP98_PLEPL|nr:unnamed protein product [Pleuronectes platessa]